MSHVRIILGFALLLAACRGESKKAEEHQPPLAAVAALEAVPAEAQVVVGVDVAHLRGSALARRAIGRVVADDPGAWGWLAELLGRCQVDPARDLDSVIVGAKDLDAGDLVLVVEGALDEGRITACLRSALADKGGVLEAVTIAGAPAYHAVFGTAGAAEAAASAGAADVAGSVGGWLAWGGPRTVLVATSDTWLGRARDPAAPKIKTQGDLRSLLDRLDARKAIWGAAVLSPDAGQAFAGIVGGAVKGAARAVTGELDTGSGGLALTLELQMQDDADAREVVAFGTAELKKLRLLARASDLAAAADRIQLDSRGRYARVSLALEPKDAEALLARLEPAQSGNVASAAPDGGAAAEEGAPR